VWSGLLGWGTLQVEERLLHVIDAGQRV